MDVQRPKVLAKFLLLVDADVLEVLVSEDDNAALGDEQRELVLLCVIQLRKLETTNLGANDRRQLGHLEARVVAGKQVRLLLVGCQPAVLELKGLQGREVGRLIVDGKIS